MQQVLARHVQVEGRIAMVFSKLELGDRPRDFCSCVDWLVVRLGNFSRARLLRLLLREFEGIQVSCGLT